MSERVRIVIETPRFGFVKRRADGGIDYVSPLPCPFNYGSVPGTLAEDGDPKDAVLLGRRRPRGAEAWASVLAVVRFTDAGAIDDKLVCGDAMRDVDRLVVGAFFRAYALLKRALNYARGRPGPTRYGGIAPAPATQPLQGPPPRL